MSKDHAKTHDENRRKICLLCFGKMNEMVTISGKVKDYIKKLSIMILMTLDFLLLYALGAKEMCIEF